MYNVCCVAYIVCTFYFEVYYYIVFMENMKIVSKEIKSDGSEFIVYLIDTSHGRPIEGFIVKEANKGKIINYLLCEYFIPDDWVNKMGDLRNNIEEIKYKD